MPVNHDPSEVIVSLLILQSMLAVRFWYGCASLLRSFGQGIAPKSTHPGSPMLGNTYALAVLEQDVIEAACGFPDPRLREDNPPRR